MIRKAIAQLARLVLEWAEPDDPTQHPVTAVREAWQMGAGKEPKALSLAEADALRRAWELRWVGPRR